MHEQLVHQAALLRRAHRRHPDDADLAAVRVAVEQAAGPALGRAAAARLLGVSQTALDRWVATGDVPVVMSPSGRMEVPVPALLDLLDAVDLQRRAGLCRPLSAALRERRASASAIRGATDPAADDAGGHRRAELGSLLYHRAVAERLDDALIADALVRLRRWREQGRIHPRYADAWEELLRGPRARLKAALRADDEQAAALRQSSPLAGALDEHERRVLLGIRDDAAA
jgi:hypothetical protein